MATWSETEKSDRVISTLSAPHTSEEGKVRLITAEVLGDDRFRGWKARPSAAAALMAIGVGVLAGLVLGMRFAPMIARWLACTAVAVAFTAATAPAAHAAFETQPEAGQILVRDGALFCHIGHAPPADIPAILNNLYGQDPFAEAAGDGRWHVWRRCTPLVNYTKLAREEIRAALNTVTVRIPTAFGRVCRFRFHVPMSGRTRVSVTCRQKRGRS